MRKEALLRCLKEAILGLENFTKLPDNKPFLDDDPGMNEHIAATALAISVLIEHLEITKAAPE